MVEKSKERKSRPGRQQAIDDTASLKLSRQDRKKLGMDSWEPSLLRKLLKAQNKLRNRD